MKPLNSRAHTYAHKTRGQALVEFSLILPILLFVTLGIIDFGRILVMFSGASGAVRDATRQATLAGTVPDTQNGGNAIERYRACGEMYQLATDFNFAEAGTGNVIQFIDILYFDTTEQTARTNAELVNALDNLNNLDASTPPDGTATLGADFDCNDGADNGWESRYSARDTVDTGQSIQDAGAGSLQNGDLIVIVMEVEIDFITPFLSDAFQNLSVTFRSQRSVVTRLQLVTSPNDRDGDSIPDILEWQYFGCLAEENPVGTANVPTTYILPDDKLVVAADTTVGYAYVTGGYPGTVTVDPTASDTQPGSDPGNAQTTPFGHPDDGGNCAIENIPEATLAGGDPAIVPTDQPYECDAGGPVDGFYQRCLVVALNLFNALDDPDNDGCVNGCEFSGGSGSGSPIDNTDVADSTDTDGDGLDDLTERTLGTNINDPDTDGDGLSDGDEVNEHNTDPRLVDTDDDGLDDDEEVEYCDDRYGVGVSCPGTDLQPDPRDPDTDNDGLIDGIEVEGFNIEDLTINGVTSTYLGITTLPGVNDTDNDGIRDGDEVNGYTAQDGTTNIRTLPNNPDTDGDRLCDGPGNGSSTPVTCERLGGVVEEDINPTTIDTDGDLLNDFQEQITFDTDPNNINTDGESCTSASGETGLFLDDFEELAGDMTENINIFTGPNTEDPDNDGVANYYDPDGDTVNNARDEDSDGDGLTDCEEVFIYGTNPYDLDTDGDANGNTDYYDVGEINNICTLPNNPDTDGDGIEDGIDPNYDEQPGEEPCDLSATSESTDNDDIPDAWEQLYYPDSGTPRWDDPLVDEDYDEDMDNCDLECEFNQGTNPREPDTDGDSVRDGYEIGTIPTDIDSDNDGLWDGREGAIGTTCVDSANINHAFVGETAHDTRCWATNPRLTDSDNDGLLDGTEADSDSKPLYDYVTANTTPGYDGTLTYTATDPTLQDTDLDGISDFREVTAGGYNVGGAVYCAGTFINPLSDDSDSDGLTDSFECRPTGPALDTVTDPADNDSDDDFVRDGTFDTSGNGTIEQGEIGEMSDADQLGFDSDPNEPDSDGDGYTDNQEVRPSINGVPTLNITYRDSTGATINSKTNFVIQNVLLGASYDPTSMLDVNGDTDGDGLSDFYEITRSPQTDPFMTDTDFDGLTDGEEENDANPATDPLTHSDFSPATPTISVSYGNNPIAVGNTTSQTFIITNQDSGIIDSVAFSNVLPVTGPNQLAYDTGSVGGTCAGLGGTGVFSTTDETNDTFSISGITLQASGNSNDSCTVVLVVQGDALGTYTGTSGIVTSTQANSTAGATATLTVANAEPTITLAFATSPVVAGNTSNLTYTVTNLSAVALTGANFTGNLTLSELNFTGSVTGTCVDPMQPYGGTATIPDQGTAGDESDDIVLNVTGMSLDASGGNDQCTVIVPVDTQDVGTFEATSTVVDSNEAMGTVTGSANLETTITEPTLSIAFTPDNAPVGSTVVFSFTVTNTGDVPLTNVNLMNALPVTGPTQLRFDNSSFAGTCATVPYNGSSAVTTTEETDDTVTIANITLGEASSGTETCTAEIDVIINASGTYENMSEVVESDQITGTTTADATLTVP